MAALREQLGRDLEEAPTVLTVDTVADYVAALQLPIFTGHAQLIASDSSSGNLNYCFIVRPADEGGPSVFVKQVCMCSAVPILCCQCNSA